MSLDDDTNKDLNDQSSIVGDSSATSRAVDTFITIARTKKGEESDTELKTDLSDDEVRIHSLLHTLSDVFDMNSVQFKSKCVLGIVINRKERKAWSKDRKSRTEIVEIVRQPAFPGEMGQNVRRESFVRRLFTPKPPQQV